MGAQRKKCGHRDGGASTLWQVLCEHSIKPSTMPPLWPLQGTSSPMASLGVSSYLRAAGKAARQQTHVYDSRAAPVGSTRAAF
jgi:hypothetical protein